MPNEPRTTPTAGGACRPCRGRLPFRLLLAGAWTLLAAAGPSAAFTQGRGWLRGSFPVAAFSGYTSPFGMRVHPIGGDSRHHDGLDIAAPYGSVVRSWWSGTVSELISDGGCGNGLVIRSGPYEHIYCHLAGEVSGGTYRSGRLLIRPGIRVRSGEPIAHVGMTGSTTGPHLHWGLRYRGRSLDPARILRAMAASRRQALTLGRPSNVGAIR
ncbi:MAG: M23 family metallopeptidase [Synechococcaceae cyanobacterium]|nr:M23 family metallopeptidase [Synechococcaceae cyanobacterium]